MKTLSKRQRIILFVLVALGVLLVALLAFVLVLLPSMDDNDQVGVKVEIPEADLTDGPGTKTDGYRRSGGIGDYWDQLKEEEDGEAATGDGRKPPQMEVGDLFGDYASSESTSPARPSGGGTGGSRKRTAPSGSSPAPKPSKEESVPPSEDASSADEPHKSAPVKRSGAVSNLDTDVNEELGNGFSTLDGTDMWVSGEAGKPYRCMFTRDEKVKSGQRVTLRLLEDLVIRGVHIPRNTHLQGVVTVSQRMEIAVTSLDMGGRIISFHFEAYDTDGGKGIYCSDLSQTKKSVTEQGLSTISSTLNGRLGRVARDAAQVGASIVRNKSGEETVTVPAGYAFYLIEEQR